jgi:Asp-tRNA(Asn)/Glu-tRNA(Gln) amidotransferase A subunit family amidase
MPDFDEIHERHNLIVAAEAAQVHADWYAGYEQLYHPKTADLIDRGRQLSRDQLNIALHGQGKLRRELTQLMDQNGLDMWISPSAVGPAPEGLDGTGDPVMNLPWTHAGLPTLSVPAGANSTGLPLGLQLAARWYDDERLVDWSAAIEDAVSS